MLPFANSDALRMNMCAMAAFRSCTCVNSTMNSASVVYDGASSVVYWLPGMCACMWATLVDCKSVKCPAIAPNHTAGLRE